MGLQRDTSPNSACHDIHGWEFEGSAYGHKISNKNGGLGKFRVQVQN